MDEQQQSADQKTALATIAAPHKEGQKRPQHQPRYHVLLWDDNHHSYEYVIQMMRAIFGHSVERSFGIASEVDHLGRAICLTTTMEHAELKRDQIHAFGKDDLIGGCRGSMSSSIEANTD